MKPLAGLVVAVVFLSTVAFSGHQRDNWTLLIVGGTEGYMSPCGCTSPMSGGIKRRITALKGLTVAGSTTIIDNGPLVASYGRQDQIKAETLAEAMSLVRVDATHFGLEEARLGTGIAETIERLTKRDAVSSVLKDVPGVTLGTFAGPFLLGAVDVRTQQIKAATGADTYTVDSAISVIIENAKADGSAPVLMLRAERDAAADLAKRHPQLKLIVCTRSGSPFVEPWRVGDTLIVTPGEHGKYVVKIEWDGEKFVGYEWFDLGPDFVDDSEAQEIYDNYLARVAHEDLISMVPRRTSEDFAGSEACVSCHKEEAKVWSVSKHAHALSTLEREGHDKDPDCVACHVVGLTSTQGFRDREKTPLLADVGCESCHGPSRAHAMNPAENRLSKVGEQSCVPCHDTGHSPNFRFDDYWPRIAHGSVDKHGKKN